MPFWLWLTRPLLVCVRSDEEFFELPAALPSISFSYECSSSGRCDAAFGYFRFPPFIKFLASPIFIYALLQFDVMKPSSRIVALIVDPRPSCGRSLNFSKTWKQREMWETFCCGFQWNLIESLIKNSPLNLINNMEASLLSSLEGLNYWFHLKGLNGWRQPCSTPHKFTLAFLLPLVASPYGARQPSSYVLCETCIMWRFKIPISVSWPKTRFSKEYAISM